MQYGNNKVSKITGPVMNIRLCPFLNYKIKVKPCTKCLKKFECGVKAERVNYERTGKLEIEEKKSNHDNMVEKLVKAREIREKKEDSDIELIWNRVKEKRKDDKKH